MTDKKTAMDELCQALDESGKLEEIQQAMREQRREKEMRRLRMCCR